MQTYPTKSGRTYFFAGLLFVLVLGACGYWMLHKEQILVENTAPQKPDIAVLDARAKPHFDRAKQNIPAVVEELTSYSSMVKFCYLASCDKLSGGNQAQKYLSSVINARIIDPCREGAINSSDIVPVFKEFKNPKHEEFAEPTRHSLLNAFTETIKKYTPGRVDTSYRQLTSCFGLDGHRPALWS